MHHLPVQISVFVLSILIAGAKALKVESDDLATLPAETDHAEETKALVTLQQVLQSNLLILNLFILIFLATIYGLFQAIALAFVWLIAVNVLAGTEVIQRSAQRFAKRHRKQLVKLAIALKPALNLLDGSRFFVMRRTFSTKVELADMIHKSRGVLTKVEKQKLQDVLEEANGN